MAGRGGGDEKCVSPVNVAQEQYGFEGPSSGSEPMAREMAMGEVNKGQGRCD